MSKFPTTALAGALLTACGGDAFSPEGVSGVYNLETLNGNSLPALSVDGTLVTAGSITLNADGTVIISFTFQLQSGNVTATDSRTFTLVGPSTIRITVDGDVLSATLDGDRLTLVGEDGCPGLDAVDRRAQGCNPGLLEAGRGHYHRTLSFR